MFWKAVVGVLFAPVILVNNPDTATNQDDFIEPQSYNVIMQSETPVSAKRCRNPIVEKKGCEHARLKALDKGCISKENYKTLKDNGYYPVCNYLKPKVFEGFCTCGCFDPDTLITVFDSVKNQASTKTAGALVTEKKVPPVTHLDEQSSLHNLMTKNSRVTHTTSGKEKKKVYRVITKSHKTLTVTSKHPVLTHKGVVKQAKDLKKSDQLVRADGSFDPIVKIKRIPFKREVVNFTVAGKTPKEHLVFANDFVVGDLYFQSSLEDLMNSVVVRK